MKFFIVYLFIAFALVGSMLAFDVSEHDMQEYIVEEIKKFILKNPGSEDIFKKLFDEIKKNDILNNGVINSSIVKNKIIFQNGNITVSKYEIKETNTNDDLRKFKDLDIIRFDKYLRIKIGDRELDQLICESTDKDGKICGRYGYLNATCFNLNYQKENAPNFNCEFINMKFSNKNIIVSNIEINCAQMPDDSHFEEPCGLVYHLFKVNGYNPKDDVKHFNEVENHSSTNVILIIVIIIIIIIALSLSICAFLSYKKRSS